MLDGQAVAPQQGTQGDRGVGAVPDPVGRDGAGLDHRVLDDVQVVAEAVSGLDDDVRAGSPEAAVRPLDADARVGWTPARRRMDVDDEGAPRAQRGPNRVEEPVARGIGQHAEVEVDERGRVVRSAEGVDRVVAHPVVDLEPGGAGCLDRVGDGAGREVDAGHRDAARREPLRVHAGTASEVDQPVAGAQREDARKVIHGSVDRPRRPAGGVAVGVEMGGEHPAGDPGVVPEGCVVRRERFRSRERACEGSRSEGDPPAGHQARPAVRLRARRAARPPMTVSRPISNCSSSDRRPMTGVTARIAGKRSTGSEPM